MAHSLAGHEQGEARCFTFFVVITRYQTKASQAQSCGHSNVKLESSFTRGERCADQGHLKSAALHRSASYSPPSVEQVDAQLALAEQTPAGLVMAMRPLGCCLLPRASRTNVPHSEVNRIIMGQTLPAKGSALSLLRDTQKQSSNSIVATRHPMPPNRWRCSWPRPDALSASPAAMRPCTDHLRPLVHTFWPCREQLRRRTVETIRELLRRVDVQLPIQLVRT